MQFRTQTTKEFVEGVTLVDVSTGLPYSSGATSDGANVSLGATTDAVATTDTGTFSLIALFKRSLQRLTSILTSQSITIGTVQYITVGATSTQSSAVGVNTNRVVLVTNTNCWISVGDNPTASKAAGSFYMSAGAQSYPISVVGGTTKIAVLQDSGAGVISIIESI